jgi:hypothetical protein
MCMPKIKKNADLEKDKKTVDMDTDNSDIHSHKTP